MTPTLTPSPAAEEVLRFRIGGQTKYVSVAEFARDHLAGAHNSTVYRKVAARQLPALEKFGSRTMIDLGLARAFMMPPEGVVSPAYVEQVLGLEPGGCRKMIDSGELEAHLNLRDGGYVQWQHVLAALEAEVSKAAAA